MGVDTKIQWCDVAPGYRVGTNGVVQSRWVHVGLGRGNGTTVVIGGEWVDLKPSLNASGYHRVNLGRGNGRLIHRLVLEAFVGPCPPGMECRHLDGNRTNNSLGNLAWGTRKENMADQVAHGTRARGQRHGMARLDDSAIDAIRDIGKARPQRDIARQFGVSQGWVSQVLNGKTRA